MKKIIYHSSVIVVVFFVCFKMLITGFAAEQAQVIYDFMELTEDSPVYSKPNSENKTDIIIPEGEKILIISQTADGWYQILYHEEILYINNGSENLEQVEISEEVIEEIEESKEDQELTEDELATLLTEDNHSEFEQNQGADVQINSEKPTGSETEVEENNRKTKTLSRVLLGLVASIVLLSGIGYLYMNKKERIEQAKKSKQMEVNILDFDDENTGL